MRFSTFDTETISAAAKKRSLSQLASYRNSVAKIIQNHDNRKPEYALVHASDPALHSILDEVTKQYKSLKHLVVVGIGGSSLGVEAVHTALGQKQVRLSVIDTIAPYELDILLHKIKSYKKTSDIAVCIISKSGGTAETMVNASIFLDALQKQFGSKAYSQIICIGDEGSDFMKSMQRKKARCIHMPKAVGGRFSVATEVGLIPLALLGHNVDAFMAGILDANEDEFETQAAEGAVTVASYIEKNYKHYNFFAFDKRLYQVGAWYRQLFAESLGKEKTKNKKPLTVGMLPTITTPVELHSVGQLYFSGFNGVYTELVTFEDDEHEHKISKTGLGKRYGGYTNQDVATAMYAGVVGAYQEKQLPYRSVIFDELSLEYSLGLFMSLRMREVMYIANLLNVDAFNQPNVELYKKKTNKVLGV